MACRIADNQALQRLSDDIGLAPVCHSLRKDCHRGLERSSGNYALGAAGAAIGYCQGLFNRIGSPEEHTRYLIGRLVEMGAPLALSHELLWNYRQGETPSQYIDEACRPLLGTGRVPIIITNLDPEENKREVGEIFASDAPIYNGESMLVRLRLSRDSVFGASALMNGCVLGAYRGKQMPKMFPLFQADCGLEVLDDLIAVIQATGDATEKAVGKRIDTSKYINIAIGPFTDPGILEKHGDKITVAQFFVGPEDGIHSDGNVLVHGNCVGSPEDISYNIFEFAERVRKLGTLPTSIICGPSKPEWTERDNLERLRKYLELFEKATETMWGDIDREAREKVMSLIA